jgi:hypothetical protein
MLIRIDLFMCVPVERGKTAIYSVDLLLESRVQTPWKLTHSFFAIGLGYKGVRHSHKMIHKWCC